MTLSSLFVCLPQYVSELRFDGFSLRCPLPTISGSSLLQDLHITREQNHLSEVSSELLTAHYVLWLLIHFFFNLTLHTVRCDYPLMLECEWWPHNWTKLLEIAFNVSALWRESCSPLFCFKWQISPPTSFQFNTTVTRRTFSIEVLNILK